MQVEKPKKKFECKSCGSVISVDKDKEKPKCACKKSDLKLLSTEYTDEEWENINLENLHKVYKENLYIEDTNRLDVVLAVALSNKLEGLPLWLILVGASGDMKSAQLKAVTGEDVCLITNLTSKTLVNGYPDKKKFPDLAPELDGKIVVIADMAQILKLPSVEKAEVWAQLRDLYDGDAGKMSGMGTRTKYENLKITLIAGSTPVIDSQILIHQDLGTRELIYRTSGSKNKEKVMRKCFENEEEEKNIVNRLSKITRDFLNKIKVERKEIPEKVLELIMKISLFVTVMRAPAEFDSYTHDLRNYVYPEEPTRIAKQLKRLYVCLKSLDNLYTDKKALEIVWEVARSSTFQTRLKIFEYLSKVKMERSTSQIAETLKIGKATVKRECSALENMDVLECRRQETSYPDRFYEFWKIPCKPTKEVSNRYIDIESSIYMGIISLDGSTGNEGKKKVENLEKKGVEILKESCIVCGANPATLTQNGKEFYCEEHASLLFGGSKV